MTSTKMLPYTALFLCFCQFLTTTAQDYIDQADIVFLLDGSDSISDGEFVEQKTLVERFITQVDIGPERVRVGVIVVSSDIGDTVDLAQSTNKNSLIKTLHTLQQPQDGSRIDLGINKLERMFYSSGRQKTAQIGVIVTDGRSKYPDASRGESEALRSVGIHLFCVGVGRLVDEKQLRSMAFKPNEYFYIEPIDLAVDKLVQSVRKLTTSASTAKIPASADHVGMPASEISPKFNALPTKTTIATTITTTKSTTMKTTTTTRKPTQPHIQPKRRGPTADRVNDELTPSRQWPTREATDMKSPSSSLLQAENGKKEPSAGWQTQDTIDNNQDSSRQWQTDRTIDSNNGPQRQNPTRVSVDNRLYRHREEDRDTNKLLKISVEANLLNGKDIVGTKIEKFVGGDPWWTQNTNPNYEVQDPTYQQPSFNEQKWYKQSDPIKAPWVNIPVQKSTPAAWKTYAPSTPSYQVYTKPQTETQTTTSAWASEYRNPLISPVTLFSINGPVDNRRTQPVYPRRPIPRFLTTTSTTTTTTTTTTPRAPVVSEPQPFAVGPAQGKDRIEEEHLCYGSQYVDGVGYNADPKSCNEFIQCFYEGGQIKVERARCPFRMFWDQRLLLCRPSGSMSCWRDPCFDFTVRSYDHKGNCRAHWSCRNGLSQAKCCPDGFAFNEEKQECVPDPGCHDWCEDSGELTFTSPFASCRMTPFETNERFYFEEIPGLGMMTRSCPRGSQYNPGLCTCDRSEEVRKNSCRPELILDFNDGFSDKSGNNLAVTPENVHIENGAARFDGSGKIRLWRFSGVSYGSQFAVTMKYKENPHVQSAEPMHLLSNCFNPEVMRPSIDIAISPNKGAMFLATTDKGGEQMSVMKYNSTSWKTLSFVYDGRHLIGNIDGKKTTVPLTGTIEERPSALILGACDYFGGYIGMMDDVKLYLCVPHGIT